MTSTERQYAALAALDLVDGDQAGRDGRRRILTRHAPDIDDASGSTASAVCCEACTGLYAVLWPCTDWLDAAAGLESA
mgnify:CR=1 FL=1